ncbi:hypothetical protein [Chitinolyticbacter meiyuanensis]|uniref:hypothetical protein n=1 Tax=Chitinolyticbacter meiyuanensis TaxID=682798 RepID=UPI0011E5C8C3|nr:hypothetical protein [Chitinolyticbacter meiyuanensis]
MTRDWRHIPAGQGGAPSAWRRRAGWFGEQCCGKAGAIRGEAVLTPLMARALDAVREMQQVKITRKHFAFKKNIQVYISGYAGCF